MLVSNIKQTSPGRFTVELDDGSEIRTTLGAVTELRLFVGRELCEADVEELKCLSERQLAREKALELLSRRMMSRSELIKKLTEKGESADTAEYCAQWLTENGFLDDGRYADAIARHYAAKGYGAGRIRTELSRRGIPRELWEEAEAPESDDRLAALIRKRLKDPSDRDEVRKLSAALYRRGFSWEEIRRALAEFDSSSDFED